MTVIASKTATQSEINVTPLIDILLVLLIIFMVITPLTPKGLETVLPQPGRNMRNSEAPVILELQADGALRLNGRDVTVLGLPAQVRNLFALRANKSLFLRGDQTLEFRQVTSVIDIIRGSNPSLQIGFLP